MAKRKDQTETPPTEGSAPAAPAPAVEPAESVASTADAPPAAAGGEPLPAGLVELPPAVAMRNDVITEADAERLFAKADEMLAPRRFRVHTQTQPDLVVEAADAGEAIAKYQAEYGITASAYPFVATPVE